MTAVRKTAVPTPERPAHSFLATSRASWGTALGGVETASEGPFGSGALNPPLLVRLVPVDAPDS